MANTKGMIMGSMVAAGLVALAALADLILGVPFAGSMVFDVLFLVAAGIVIYMGWEAYRDQTP